MAARGGAGKRVPPPPPDEPPPPPSGTAEVASRSLATLQDTTSSVHDQNLALRQLQACLCQDDLPSDAGCRRALGGLGEVLAEFLSQQGSGDHDVGVIESAVCCAHFLSGSVIHTVMLTQAAAANDQQPTVCVLAAAIVCLLQRYSERPKLVLHGVGFLGDILHLPLSSDLAQKLDALLLHHNAVDAVTNALAQSLGTMALDVTDHCCYALVNMVTFGSVSIRGEVTSKLPLEPLVDSLRHLLRMQWTTAGDSAVPSSTPTPPPSSSSASSSSSSSEPYAGLVERQVYTSPAAAAGALLESGTCLIVNQSACSGDSDERVRRSDMCEFLVEVVHAVDTFAKTIRLDRIQARQRRRLRRRGSPVRAARHHRQRTKSQDHDMTASSHPHRKRSHSLDYGKPKVSGGDQKHHQAFAARERALRKNNPALLEPNTLSLTLHESLAAISPSTSQHIQKRKKKKKKKKKKSKDTKDDDDEEDDSSNMSGTDNGGSDGTGVSGDTKDDETIAAELTSSLSESSGVPFSPPSHVPVDDIPIVRVVSDEDASAPEQAGPPATTAGSSTVLSTSSLPSGLSASSRRRSGGTSPSHRRAASAMTHEDVEAALQSDPKPHSEHAMLPSHTRPAQVMHILHCALQALTHLADRWALAPKLLECHTLISLRRIPFNWLFGSQKGILERTLSTMDAVFMCVADWYMRKHEECQALDRVQPQEAAEDVPSSLMDSLTPVSPGSGQDSDSDEEALNAISTASVHLSDSSAPARKTTDALPTASASSSVDASASSASSAQQQRSECRDAMRRFDCALGRELEGVVGSLVQASQTFPYSQTIQCAFLRAIAHCALTYQRLPDKPQSPPRDPNKGQWLMYRQLTQQTGAPMPWTEEEFDSELALFSLVPMQYELFLKHKARSGRFSDDLPATLRSVDRQVKGYGLPAIIRVVNSLHQEILVAGEGIKAIALLSGLSWSLCAELIQLRAHAVLTQLLLTYNAGHHYNSPHESPDHAGTSPYTLSQRSRPASARTSPVSPIPTGVFRKGSTPSSARDSPISRDPPAQSGPTSDTPTGSSRPGSKAGSNAADDHSVDFMELPDLDGTSEASAGHSRGPSSAGSLRLTTKPKSRSLPPSPADPSDRKRPGGAAASRTHRSARTRPASRKATPPDYRRARSHPHHNRTIAGKHSTLTVTDPLGTSATGPAPLTVRSPTIYFGMPRTEVTDPKDLLLQILVVLSRMCDTACSHPPTTLQLIKSSIAKATYRVLEVHTMEEDTLTAALSVLTKLLSLPALLDLSSQRPTPERGQELVLPTDAREPAGAGQPAPLRKSTSRDLWKLDAVSPDVHTHTYGETLDKLSSYVHQLASTKYMTILEDVSELLCGYDLTSELASMSVFGLGIDDNSLPQRAPSKDHKNVIASALTTSNVKASLPTLSTFSSSVPIKEKPKSFFSSLSNRMTIRHIRSQTRTLDSSRKSTRLPGTAASAPLSSSWTPSSLRAALSDVNETPASDATSNSRSRAQTVVRVPPTSSSGSSTHKSSAITQAIASALPSPHEDLTSPVSPPGNMDTVVLVDDQKEPSPTSPTGVSGPADITGSQSTPTPTRTVDPSGAPQRQDTSETSDVKSTDAQGAGSEEDDAEDEDEQQSLQTLRLVEAAVRFGLAYVRCLANLLSLYTPNPTIDAKNAYEALTQALALALSPTSVLESDGSLAARSVFAVADIMAEVTKIMTKLPPPPSSTAAKLKRRGRIVERIQRLKIEAAAAIEGLRSVIVGTGHVPIRSGLQLRRAIAYFKTKVRVGAQDSWKSFIEKKYSLQSIHQQYVVAGRRVRRDQAGIRPPPPSSPAPPSVTAKAVSPDDSKQRKKPLKASKGVLTAAQRAEQLEVMRRSLSLSSTLVLPVEHQLAHHVHPTKVVISADTSSTLKHSMSLQRGGGVLLATGDSQLHRHISLTDANHSGSSLDTETAGADEKVASHKVSVRLATPLSAAPPDIIASRGQSQSSSVPASPTHSRRSSDAKVDNDDEEEEDEEEKKQIALAPRRFSAASSLLRLQKFDGDVTHSPANNGAFVPPPVTTHERRRKKVAPTSVTMASRSGRPPPRPHRGYVRTRSQRNLAGPPPLTRSSSLPLVTAATSGTQAVGVLGPSSAASSVLPAPPIARSSSGQSVVTSAGIGLLRRSIDWSQLASALPQSLGLSLEERWRAAMNRARTRSEESAKGGPQGHISTSYALRHDEEVLQMLGEDSIPDPVRGPVWMILSGAQEEREKWPTNYYSQLVSYVDLYAQEHLLWRDEIRKDVHRTLPSVPMFRSTEGKDRLERVLSAYVLRNPETVGYCQSMNLLAGALLTVPSLDEEAAFWMLATMIERRVGYYARSMCGLKVDQGVLEDIFSFSEPELDDHLKSFDVSVSTFTVSWFLCLFMEAPLKLQGCLRFWDNLFLFGDEVLFATAMAILRRKRADMLALTSYEELLDFVLHGGLKKDLDIEDLLADIQRIMRESNGALLDHIHELREYHQVFVLEKNKRLDMGQATLLATKFKFENVEEVQDMWTKFLSPAPWDILLSGCISCVVHFRQAFCPVVFPSWHRGHWRDRGNFSGVIERLFQVLDANGTGKISFDEYLCGVYLFLQASLQERLALCFQFCDLDGDGKIAFHELTTAFTMLHELYCGRSHRGAAAQGARLFAIMTFDRAHYISQGKNLSVWSWRTEHMAPICAGSLTATQGDGTALNNVDEKDKDSTQHAVSSSSSPGRLPLGVPCDVPVVPRPPEPALDFEDFCRVIAFHPLVKLFFGLEDVVSSGSSSLSSQWREFGDTVQSKFSM